MKNIWQKASTMKLFSLLILAVVAGVVVAAPHHEDILGGLLSGILGVVTHLLGGIGRGMAGKPPPPGFVRHPYTVNVPTPSIQKQVCAVTENDFPTDGDIAGIISFLIKGTHCILTNSVNKVDGLVSVADSYAVQYTDHSLNTGNDNGLQANVQDQYRDIYNQIAAEINSAISDSIKFYNLGLSKISKVSNNQQILSAFGKSINDNLQRDLASVNKDYGSFESYAYQKISNAITEYLNGPHDSDADIVNAVNAIKSNLENTNKNIFNTEIKYENNVKNVIVQ